MAKTISQRLTLEGTDEILRQLQQLARTASQTFDKIAQSAGATAPSIQKVGTAAAQAGRELVPAARAADQFSRSANEAAVASRGFGSSLTTLAATAAGVVGALTLLGAGMLAMARSAAGLASSIGRAADAAKTSVGNLQQMRNVLVQLGLTTEEADEATKTWGDTNRKVTDAARKYFKSIGQTFPETVEGTKALEQAILGLGITLRGGKRALDEGSAAAAAFGKELTPDALLAFGRHLATITDETKRTALATRQLGEVQGRFLSRLIGDELAEFGAGMEFADEKFKLLNDSSRIGTIALEKFVARAKQFAPIIEEQRKASDRFKGALGLLAQVSEVAQAQLGLVFQPALTPLILRFTEAVYGSQSRLVQLATTIRDAVIPVLDDLIKMFAGAQDFEIRTEWLLTLRNSLASVATTAARLFNTVLLPGLAAAETLTRNVVAEINRLIGTQIDLGDLGLVTAVTMMLGPVKTLALALAALFTSTDPAILKFKEQLKSIGVDVDALGQTIKRFIVDTWNDLVAAFQGREIKQEWIRDAIALWNELKGPIAAVGAALFLFRRELVALTAVGIFNELTGAVTAFAHAMTGLFFAVLLIQKLGPLGLVLAGLAAGFLLVRDNGALAKQALVAFGVDAVTAQGLVDGLLGKVNQLGQAILGFEQLRQEEGLLAAIIGDLSKITFDPSALMANLESLGQQIQAWWQRVWDNDIVIIAVSGMINQLIVMFQGLGPQLAGIWDGIVASWTGALNGFAQFALSVIQDLAAAVARLRTALTGSPDTSGASVGAFARGGRIGGRGSGTSDSNLAWVSRGEHIMPARAVQQPGVLALLEALRRSGGNLRHVLDGMGRFALGGMMLPRFAEGGLAGGMSNVTIQFPGLPPISGLRASSEVVDELRKAAALAQVRSGGRKPSRYS